MFGFGKKKAVTEDEFEEAAADVQKRIASGDYDGAAQAATALRKAVEANNGEETALASRANAIEARAALALADTERAIERMRVASSVEGDDPETVELRLQHEMDLGDMLSELGRNDEAEAVHREALEKRRAYYGEDDPGFGYGAESLGTVLLRKGDYGGAAALGQQAAAAFQNGPDNKRSASLMLWALAEKAQRTDEHVLDDLEEDDREMVVHAIASAPAYLFIDATIDLRWEVYDHLEDVDEKFACLGTIATHSRAQERMDDHIQALRVLVDLTKQHAPDDTPDALRALALAYEDIGLAEDSAAALVEADALDGD